MIKITELQAILAKASQLLGDAPVILKAVEGDVETAFHSIDVSITGSDPSEGGTVTIVHGPASEAPAAPAAETPAPDAGSTPPAS